MFAIGGFLVFFLVMGITYDVVGRRFLGASAPGVVEISEYIMVWLPFLAAGRLMREGGHVRVLFVLDRLGPRARAIVERVVMVVGLAVLVILTWYSVNLVTADYERGVMLVNIYTTPRWIVRSMVPVGFFVLALEFVRCIWRQWSGHSSYEPDGRPGGEILY